MDQLNQTEFFPHPRVPLFLVQLMTISKSCLPRTYLIVRIKLTLDKNQTMVSYWKCFLDFFSSFSNSISGFLLQATSSAGCVSFQQPVPFQRTGPRVSGQIYFDLSEKYSYWLLHLAHSPGTQIWNGSLNVGFVLDQDLSLQSMSMDCKKPKEP